MTDSYFEGQIKGSNYSIDYYQTPDGIKDGDGKLLRPNARYSKEKGYDSAQQDNAFMLPAAPDLRQINLEKIFDDLRDSSKTNDIFISSGTTASIAHISKEGFLTVAHVGDSPVNIYVRSPETKEIVESHLITRPHTPMYITQEEIKDVFNKGGFVKKGSGRLNGRLMLTRSLGDFDQQGISSRPEISTFDMQPYFDKGYEVFVTVESDGAGENTKESQRTEILKKDSQVLNMAEKMATLSNGNGTNDNITSLVAVFKELPCDNIIMAVFDGHGKKGGEASHIATEYMSANFDVGNRAVRTVNPDMNSPSKPVIKPKSAGPQP